MRAELNRLGFLGIAIAAGSAPCLDQIDRALGTSGGDHLDVEIDFNAPTGTALRVVFLLSLLIELFELCRSEAKLGTVHRKIRRDVRIVERIDDADDLALAFCGGR